MPSSASAGMEPIDLTLDDDVEMYRRPKRARRNDGDDSDVEVVDEPVLAPVSASQAAEEPQLDQDEDILITKHTGQVQGWWSYHKCPFQVEWHMFGPLFSSSRVTRVMPFESLVPHRRSGMSTCLMSGHSAECIPSKRIVHPRMHRTAAIATATSVTCLPSLAPHGGQVSLLAPV